jgi:hypothetical protein
MTEEEWLAKQESPKWMISHILRQGKVQRTKAGKRKLRLFACGVCRRLWHLLDDGILRPALEVAERFAEGEVGSRELNESSEATRPLKRVDQSVAAEMAAWMVWTACSSKASYAALGACSFPVTRAGHPLGNFSGEAVLCHLVRDVFGNPFRPAIMKREWVAANDRSVEAVARAIYQDRALERMPILTDALEDAGCDDEAILAHCRGPGPHVRGCWVVDLILGKG